VAALAFAFLDPKYQIPIFIYACVSEFLDGFLARALKAESSLGKILDPIADKTFILTVIVTLMSEDRLHFYQLLMVGYRDLTVIGGALVVLASGNLSKFKGMDPGWIGKVTTGVQFIFLFSILYLGEVSMPLLLITMMFSVYAAIYYVKFFFDQGLFVEDGVQVTSVVSKKRRAEMLVLVGLTMFLGILLIISGWVQSNQGRLIDELYRSCGAACQGVGL
jgi:CDP-diacylglycerol--glycerol-3-phosphate 3-phosphatidyltransferase